MTIYPSAAPPPYILAAVSKPAKSPGRIPVTMPGMAKDTPTISTRHAAAAEIVVIVLRRRCSLRCLAAMRRFVSAKRSSWLRICDSLPFQ